MIFECWPRFSKVADGDKAQYPGWPLTVRMDDNDGRKPAGWLPELVFKGHAAPVVQVIVDFSGEVLYTIRTRGERFRPRVYSSGPYSVKVGRDIPDGPMLKALTPGAEEDKRTLDVQL